MGKQDSKCIKKEGIKIFVNITLRKHFFTRFIYHYLYKIWQCVCCY